MTGAIARPISLSDSTDNTDDGCDSGSSSSDSSTGSERRRLRQRERFELIDQLGLYAIPPPEAWSVPHLPGGVGDLRGASAAPPFDAPERGAVGRW